MILLLGRAADPVIQRLSSALAAAGQEFATIDPADHPGTVRIELTLTDGKVSGSLDTGSRRTPMEEVQAVFDRADSTSARPGPDGRPRGPGPDLLLAEFVDHVTALVVNPASAQASNASKPYQYGAIRAAGLAVPKTLVTSDPDAARDILDDHPEGVIYKSVSSVRSKVSLLDAAAAGRLDDVRSGPVQLQEYVAGQDVRVHVIAGEAFARAVTSTASDYRYPQTDAEAPRIGPFTLPDAVRDACVNLADRLGLYLAGLDLRRRPDGRWVCFEANPQPAYTFYEPAHDDHVTPALVRLLTTGECRPDVHDEHLVPIPTHLCLRAASEIPDASIPAKPRSPFITRDLRPDLL